jgi:hypothetical protein
MGFLGLLNERRYVDSRRLWLPKRRLPTPGFFYVASTSGRATIRAEEGAGIPRAARSWTADGFSLAAMILVDARPNTQEPANSGLAIAWIRYPDSGQDPVLLGRGKGVWDCEKRRLAMWVGSEGTVADEAAAREIAAGQCRRRPNNAVIRRFNQQALLCGKPRARN